MFGLGLRSDHLSSVSDQLIPGTASLCCRGRRARGAEWRWGDLELGRGVGRGGADMIPETAPICEMCVFD